MALDSPADPSQELARQLQQVRVQLDDLHRRLARLERATPHAAAAAPPRIDQRELLAAAAQAEVAEPTAAREVVEIFDAELVEGPAARNFAGEERREKSEGRAAAVVQPLSPTLPSFDFGEKWEELVGGRWLTWAGALTLIVAVAFFVPWAWTELDLPNWSKVLMLHALGIGLAIGAFVLHRRELKVFAQGIAGIAIFTLYASAWAAQHLYKIYDGPTGELITFVECAVITAVVIAAAVRTSSVAIVLLGALGGYLTPMIASSGSGNHIALFTYLAFLNVALVGCAVLRGWSFLKPLALAATMLMFFAWLGSSTFRTQRLDDTWSTQWLLTLHWAIFLLGATLPPLVWQRRSHWFDLAALTAGSLWFVGTTWLLFHEREGQQLALVCCGMTLLHLALFGATFNRVTNADRMPRTHLALAGIFFILATPLQLEDSLSYLALAWSAQGAMLAIVGIWFRDRAIATASLLVYALATVRLFVDYAVPPELLGAVDRRFLMFEICALLMLVGGASYLLLGRVLPKSPDDATFWRPLGGTLLAGGNVLAMIGLTLQWDSRLVLLLWTIDAALIWAAGFWLKIMPVRAYALLLSIFFVGGRMLFHNDDVAAPFVLLANDRFGTLLLVALLYLGAAWTYRRVAVGRISNPSALPLWADGLEIRPTLLAPPLAVLGNLVLITALSLEIHSWFDAALARGSLPFRDMRMAELAAYSILWAVYAAAAVVLGMLLRWPTLRVIGLIGLALTLVKVFFVDLASLQLFPRILALAVLGMMLLGVSFLYQKFRRTLANKQ